MTNAIIVWCEEHRQLQFCCALFTSGYVTCESGIHAI